MSLVKKELTPEEKVGILFRIRPPFRMSKEDMIKNFGCCTKKGIIQWYKDNPKVFFIKNFKPKR